jgi:hypothetical protein
LIFLGLDRAAASFLIFFSEIERNFTTPFLTIQKLSARVYLRSPCQILVQDTLETSRLRNPAKPLFG